MRYAIDAQNRIGYINLFCGKLSIHWLELFDKRTLEPGGKHQDSSLWGASILEVIIRQYIKLWETRNKEIHDKKTGDDILAKSFYINEVKRLHAFKYKVRPRDKFLFVDNLPEFLEKSTPHALAQYIISHQKAIKHSVCKWKTYNEKGTPSVLDWLGSSNDANKDKIRDIHERQRKDLMDGRQKERRRTRQRDSRVQLRITKYMH